MALMARVGPSGRALGRDDSVVPVADGRVDGRGAAAAVARCVHEWAPRGGAAGAPGGERSWR